VFASCRGWVQRPLIPRAPGNTPAAGKHIDNDKETAWNSTFFPAPP
jgi:hypothetical protein